MNDHIWVVVLERLCRLALGGLFVASAVAKIGDPGAFADAVARYEMLPGFAVGIFSLAMPMLELLAGLALILTVWTRESALLISCMLVMFIIALGQAVARGLEISCGCFGVPGEGGRAEMLWALGRDIAMLPFAVWLASRVNSWILPVGKYLHRRAVGVAIAAIVLGALPSFAAVKVSSGPVKPGEWNVDFDAVRAAAERDHRPMVLMHVGQRCLYCARMEKAISGEAFRLWREDRAPYMAFVRSRVNNDQAEIPRKSYEFVSSISSNLTSFPYIGVYWPKAGHTNKVAFVGRREFLKVKEHHRLLVMDFMAALDGAMGFNPAANSGHKTLAEILKASPLRISAKAEGDGTVAMKPANGVLLENASVALAAKPGKASAFVCWRTPGGAIASWGRKLEVVGGMEPGCYTALFKPRAECLPPRIAVPASTSLCTRVYERIKYAVAVDDACRPVSFRSKQRLPRGLKLNDVTGVLSGAPLLPSTNTIQIIVTGSDPARTEATVRVRIEAVGE